jgi:hypothetical protein
MQAVDHVDVDHVVAVADSLGELGDVRHPFGDGVGRHREQLGQVLVRGAERAERPDEMTPVRGDLRDLRDLRRLGHEASPMQRLQGV